MNKIYAIDLSTKAEIEFPYNGAELILHRIYTIGEIAKIVEKRPDTIRKYEKRNLISTGKKFSETCDGYKNWRYYEKNDVYDMVSFFNGRMPGRPSSNKSIPVKVIRMSQKIKINRR